MIDATLPRLRAMRTGPLHPRGMAEAILYVSLGIIAVPVGGTAEIVLLYGEVTPLVALPPNPSIFHTATLLLLFAGYRLILPARWDMSLAMGAGFAAMALLETRLAEAFPHVWMKIYELALYLC
ncbi:hypothetical protein [Gymnodinialimonas hymeniacidonis]|uniref:hypothetical protein n=1 Tax=Gymnodinialimonas hymeniacidonis TaxID=3126508 RepID=UPI0034C69B07